MRRDQRCPIAIAGDTCAFLSYPRLSNRAKNKAAEAELRRPAIPSEYQISAMVKPFVKFVPASVIFQSIPDLIPIRLVHGAVIEFRSHLNAVRVVIDAPDQSGDLLA